MKALATFYERKPTLDISKQKLFEGFTPNVVRVEIFQLKNFLILVHLFNVGDCKRTILGGARGHGWEVKGGPNVVRKPLPAEVRERDIDVVMGCGYKWIVNFAKFFEIQNAEIECSILLADRGALHDRLLVEEALDGMRAKVVLPVKFVMKV